jgi:hypothetical protein
MSEAQDETQNPETGGGPLPGQPGVAVYQGLPDVEMVVNPGNEVSPSGEDVTYYEGETFTVDGPTAIALAAGGHATAVGGNGADAAVAASSEPPAEEAPPA